MAQPVDIRNLSPQALADLLAALNPNLLQSEVQQAFEDALAAAEPIDVNVVGGSSVPFSTVVQNVPGDPTVTQLSALPCANGAIIRASDDMIVYNSATPAATDGFIVYEGDDIRMTTVTNLDQVFVKPVKNSAIDVWAMTL